LNSSRTKNTMRNFGVGIGGYIFGYLLSFINRTVFIFLLGSEYLGINGLFTNILALLSLSELGIGGAFITLLYKPLHDGDEKKVNSIMAAFKKAYMIVASFVAVVGLSLIPFLDFFVAKNDVEDLTLIYCLFLSGSILSYLYAPRVSFIIANQQNYIVTIYRQASAAIQYILQMLILVLTHNYILYLILQILCPFIANALLSRRAKKMYPALGRKAEPLAGELLDDAKQKIKGAFFLHAGYVVVTGTDSIVITKFLGLALTGIYSNYLLIIQVITHATNIVFQSVSASIGDLVAEGDREKIYAYFNRMMFLAFVIQGFSCICLVTLFNPFIQLWIGETYLLPVPVVILAVAVYFINWNGYRRPMIVFKNASGLYYNDRYCVLVEAIANVVISVILVQKIGIGGVLLGTIISANITLWSSAYVLYKHLFCRPVWEFAKRFFFHVSVILLIGVPVFHIVNMVPHGTWIGFFLMLFACAGLAGGSFTLLFYRTEEFMFFRNLGKSLCNGLTRRKKVNLLKENEINNANVQKKKEK